VFKMYRFFLMDIIRAYEGIRPYIFLPLVKGWDRGSMRPPLFPPVQVGIMCREL
jgi:fructose 1,6-bisphosphatase